MSRYIAIFSSHPQHALSMAQSLSPRVQVHATGGVILEVPDQYEEAALDQLLQLNAASGRIDFGAASTRTAALFAARARPGSSIPPQKEASFMASFPVGLLSLSGVEIDQATLETLKRWGVRTLGELARLPQSELVARLGETGQFLQRLARGEDRLPFQPRGEEPRFEMSQEFEWDLDSLEPLTFVLGGLLEKLCGRLSDRGLATDRLRIVLRLCDGVSYERAIPLAFPMRNPKTLLSLLRLKLQSEAPQAAIRGVSLEARPSRPQTMQRSLLEPASPHPEELSRTLARLSALTGEGNVGSPQPLNERRPDAFLMQQFTSPSLPAAKNGSRSRSRAPSPRAALLPEENFLRTFGATPLTLKRCRPPACIQIQTERIVACAGPWRSSGQWWEAFQNGSGKSNPLNSERAADWSRDEWDVEFVDGRICRVFWDRKIKKWFLEGIYD